MSIFPTKILLATDGSKEATLAARTATDIADRTGSELHIVHVGEFLPTLFAYAETEPGQVRREALELLEVQVGRIRAARGTIIEPHLRIGRPAEEIIALGEELGVGLIVLGSRGLGKLRRVLIGSVSDSVVRHAHCPVLVVRKEK